MSESRIVLVTGSTGEPVSRGDVKLWLKIEEEEVTDDALIDSLITTARAKYEAYTRRVPLIQTFDAYWHDVPDSNAVCLERFPLVSVTSIRGLSDTDATDTGGTAMSSSGWYVDTASEPGQVVALGSFTFPVSTRVANGFIVRFTAGHSSGSSGVPEYLKTTLKNMITRAYIHRGDQPQAEIEALMDDVLHDEFSVPEWG